MYRPILPITQVNGFPIAPGYYEAFEVADLKALIRSAATPEQQAYNAAHKTCRACNGQGYHVYKRGSLIIRESVGCDICLGTGAVPRSEDD